MIEIGSLVKLVGGSIEYSVKSVTYLPNGKLELLLEHGDSRILLKRSISQLEIL